MALALFARRPEPVEAPAPEPWPETGETWKPEGVTIAQRYYNQAHAVVLVYTTDDGRSGTYYSIACLGCHFATRENGERTYNTRYGLADAAKVANEHATTCRALSRDIPARPDDDTVRERLYSWVRGARHRDKEVQLYLSYLDLIRLTVQRNNAWIETELQRLAADEPDVLRTERSEYSDAVFYYAQQLPEN
ncbi:MULTISPECIES: hypothetical protein [unclassified Streptomyces]|uniref:hypothetical protein n=1 Tax=unclassified Streptomyces TaxID=2593676 RepID=UPI00136F43EA|nr:MULTISPECIES: hypothetical protein [unclassified Streptomyces]NEA05827.1 hypothetical protein [Streptomyces sp. SID10116]MYY80852.1 hypothetical protein [Streptomyces sp. SID335]MYZ13299.1 hypothetical protein [Streptomyces sp. SID337]NDZ85690.1 hypothetical protein [Streptomyces sp. SID10115]NEB49978.1 hypothetical protein [Streptomyces sp. SID339]